MANPPRVRLIATGGTIATTYDTSTGQSAPRLSADHVAEFASGMDVVIEPEALAATPSWMLDPQAMVAIGRRARDAAREPGVRGVVVTHGTTTLEYTAFLADALLDVATPVVFTGAMRRADDRQPDGPRNVRDAIRVALSDAARDRGALVVFHGHVIAGSRAWKARRVEDDAFIDTAGDLGTVDDDEVRMGDSVQRYGPFTGALQGEVALVKVLPGMNADVIRRMPSSIPGLVVEALPGAGGIPPAMQRELSALAGHVPVVIAPRAPIGTLPRSPTGGTGEPLASSPFLSCGPLTAEQAWLLLMLVLGETTDPAAARARFEREVSGVEPPAT